VSSWATSKVGRGDSSSFGLTGASSSFGTTSQVFWVGWECDVVYGRSPISPGDGGFVYIEGPIRLEILLSLKEAKNPLVLMWSRTSSLVYSVWSSSYSVSYKDCAMVTCLLTYTPW